MTTMPLSCALPDNTRLWDAIWPTLGETGLINAHTPSYFEVCQQEDSWTICQDSVLIETHATRVDAVLSVRRAMHAIFRTGASADWRLVLALA